MAEENSAGEAGTPASGASVTLGLAAASRERADSFLQKQEALIDLQAEEMRERNPYERSHLRLRRFSEWARAALEASLGLIAIVIVAVLGVTVWNAAHSGGHVIESFAVPPDLAARGVTGEVVAVQLVDRLTAMQTATFSGVVNQGYSGGGGDEIKVEIPQTGISIGELYRFLRRWLGHETHISGEVVRNAAGLAVTVRTGTRGADTATGAETDLDALLQKTAQNIYRRTEPYLYVRYLVPPPDAAAGVPHLEEARAVLAEMLRSSPTHDQSLAWNQLGIMAYVYDRDPRLAGANYRKALGIEPDNGTYLRLLAGMESHLGHAEAALAGYRKAAERLAAILSAAERDSDGGILMSQALSAGRTGDYRGGFALLQRAATTGPGGRNAMLSGSPVQGLVLTSVQYLALQHDVGAARTYAAQLPPATGTQLVPSEINRLVLETTLENWAGVIALMPSVEKAIAAESYGLTLAQAQKVFLQPALALARAKLGDIAGAESLITATAGDCYDCVRIRGQIASEAKQWGRADYWFAKAVADAPSIPMAHEDWGRALLDRGKPDEAIAQFTLAIKKGPHFADPLEGWGEALMAKNQSHLALAKFAEAEKYSPNWGRLHLKWGQALTYASKKDEAAKQFARAAQLDLTPSEKAELAQHP